MALSSADIALLSHQAQQALYPSAAPTPGPTIPDLPTINPASVFRPTIRPSRGNLRETQNTPADTQLTLSAAEKPVRVAYGHQRLGAEVIWVGKEDPPLQMWVFHLRWCWGEIQAIQDLHLANEPVGANVDQVHYLGTTTQGVDPILARLIPGFTDTLVANIGGQQRGIAHSVVRVSYPNMPDSVDFTAEVAGLKIYDPRDGGTRYSTNPALQLHDFATSAFYGPGWLDDEPSLIALANMNDEDVGGGARYIAHHLVDRPAGLNAQIATMTEAAGCFVNHRAGTLYYVPNRPGAPVETFDLRAVSIEGTLQVRAINRLDAPNIVRVRYTNTDVIPWSEERAVASTPEVDSGAEFPRPSVLQASYIHDHAVAKRLAVEVLNSRQLPEFSLAWAHVDDGVRLERGTIVNLDQIPGFPGPRDVRILRRDMVRAGGGFYWLVHGRHYVSGEYSDVVETRQPPPAPTVDNPIYPVAVTDLAVSESPWLDHNGTYQTQLLASWTGVDHAQTTQYRVAFTNQATGDLVSEVSVVHQGPGDAHSCTSSVVSPGVQYRVDIWAVTAVGYISDVDTVLYTATGDALGPPPDVTGVTLTERLWVDASGITYSALDVNWDGSADQWVRAYRVLVGAGGNVVAELNIVHQGPAITHLMTVQSAEQGIEHEVRVWAINVEGDISTNYDSDTLTPQGRVALPADATNFEAVEYTDFLELSWDNVLGPGDNSYRIKRGRPGSTWANADLMDFTIYENQLAYSTAGAIWRDYDIEEGESEYFIKALSNEGLESLNAAQVSIDVKTSKGSRGKERPRSPTSILDPKSLHDEHIGAFNVRDNVYGYMATEQFFDNANWQSFVDFGPDQSGVLMRFTVGFRFAAYSSGEARIGVRIIIDGRPVWEYLNRLAKPPGSDANITFTPVGQVFLKPDGKAIADLCDDYHPFNRSLQLEILNDPPPTGMTLTCWAGANWLLT